MLASLVLAAALPATAVPLAGPHSFVGTWSCTYRAGAVRTAYAATYAYGRDGHTLRQIASWAGDDDEVSLAYDAQRGARSCARPAAIRTRRRVYLDANIAETF